MRLLLLTFFAFQSSVTAAGNVSDSLITAAEQALAAGRPWKASRAVAPLLESPTTRTPSTVLLAARAAAGWDGWESVTKLLMGLDWLDTSFEADGRALLARAMVERGDPNAVDHARLAVTGTTNERKRGERYLVLARAHDRTGRLDSASASYRQAASRLPVVADWLQLRAAGVLVDSTARADLFAQVKSPAARNRVRWTDALASERTGHLSRAIRLYEQLGSNITALRLRAVTAKDDAAKAQVRRDMVALLPKLSIAQVPPALTILDAELAPLSREDELVASRRAAAAGQLERSARGFAKVSRSATLAEGDRITYGTVLARLGRHREAITQFERVKTGPRLVEAKYLRARSLFRTAGDAAANAALREVRDSSPGENTWSATAAWLLADSHVEDGNDSAAVREFTELAQRYPGTSHGERAAFQASIIRFIAGEDSAAALGFDRLVELKPGGSETTAAIYWSGRAWEAAGDSARAKERWRSLLARYPQSYYVVPAATRLGVAPWSPPAGSPGPVPPDVAETLRRAALLDTLGLEAEVRFEYDRLMRESMSADAMVATATGLRDAGKPAMALRLAQRALDRGAAPDSTLMRLLYPLVAREALEADAGALELSPFLMAGLIRQESAFDPVARSRADARGLMQVMPAVGASYARSEGINNWETVLLYQPDLNMHFGLRHFAERLVACDGQIESTLAAYNAGEGPVNRWLKRAGTADPEIFIERIPYVETRDYVRRVRYNEARYESLYGKPKPVT
jgi:soluble lytic murein transglycosylase